MNHYEIKSVVVVHSYLMPPTRYEVKNKNLSNYQNIEFIINESSSSREVINCKNNYE